MPEGFAPTWGRVAPLPPTAVVDGGSVDGGSVDGGTVAAATQPPASVTVVVSVPPGNDGLLNVTRRMYGPTASPVAWVSPTDEASGAMPVSGDMAAVASIVDPAVSPVASTVAAEMAAVSGRLFVNVQVSTWRPVTESHRDTPTNVEEIPACAAIGAAHTAIVVARPTTAHFFPTELNLRMERTIPQPFRRDGDHLQS